MMPTITELTNRYLARPHEAVVPDGGVEPYDVITAFRVEPRLAWTETHFVLKTLGFTGSLKMPSEWSSTVRSQIPATFIPMAFGFYPQMVSDLSKLFDSDSVSLRGPMPTIDIPNHAEIQANQQAASDWVAGRDDTAIRAWQTLQNPKVKAFNLGMAYAAQRKHALAKEQLSNAISHLSDSSGWKSLAELYRSLSSAEA